MPLVASLLALALLSLGLFTSQASATYIHLNEPTRHFGSDGSSNITNETSFYSETISSIAIDSTRHRLYVVHFRNTYDRSNGTIFPGPARGIYAFDISDPAHPKPLSGNFPIAIPEQQYGYDKIAVDENDGSIYMVEKAEECYCEPGGTLFSWNTEGKLRAGYPIHISKYGPLAIDPKGYLWVWREQNSSAPNSNVVKYAPDGTVVQEVNGEITSPYVGPPENLVFDRNTEDLWLFYYEGAVKFTADSNYTHHEPPVHLRLSGEGGAAVDSANHVLYDPALFGGSVEATNMGGGISEDQFGYGGTDYEYAEKCGGQCTPEVPETKIRALAYDEPSGDIYVASDTHAGQTTSEESEMGGGWIEVFPGIGAADAQTEPPEAIGKTDATLAATVGQGEDGPVTGCNFEYADEASYGNVRTVSVNGATHGRFRFSSAEKWIQYNATAFEVEHSWTYGELPTVTGPPGGPWRIETKGEDLGKIEQKVELRYAELKPAGTKVRIDWAGQTAPCEPAVSGGSPIEQPAKVTAHISGLENQQTYHYRVIAESSAGRVYGNVESLTTTPGKVNTGAATAITQSGATLNGTVDPEGEATTYYFEYGRTAEYGSTTSAPPGESLGTTTPGDQPVSNPVTGLEPGKTYHYRIVAVNGAGTSRGADRTFTTTAAVKDVETEPATEVHRADAMLHGKLDPAGAETHYYFEWGPSRRYGQTSATPPGTAVPDTSAGDKQLSFEATGLTAGTIYHYRIVATSSAGTTFGNDETFTTQTAVLGVTTEPATEIEVENATLNGKLDPDGIPTTFYFEYGKTTSYGQVAPAPPGVSVEDSSPGVKPVSYVLKGLEPGTTYHYRLVGANETGSTIDGDQSFTTKQGPAIEGVRSEHVTADSAELLARINPDGYPTEWYFEYGPTTAYGSTAPIPVGSLPAGKESAEVSVDLTGLQNVVYHFRLIAKSEWGEVVSEDQTFEFAAQRCPNAVVRQQTGANYLPDCRAYELVTPARAGGAPITPPAPFSQLADNHLGFSAILNAIPGTEPPNAGVGLPHTDFYVASRTSRGWKTHYVGVKGNETLESSEVPWRLDWEGSSGYAADSQLERFLAWDRHFPCCGDNGNYIAHLYNAEGEFLGRLPTNAAEIPGAEKNALTEGGYRGDAMLSGDGRQYIFSSNKVAFTPDGLTKTPGSAYINDIETGAIEKISLDEDGEDLKQDPKATGSNLGQEFIKFIWASNDGSHVLMSLTGPNKNACVYYCAGLAENLHLYMWVKGHGTYDVSKDYKGVDRAVKYAGITSDGSEVFFTSPEQMTADDNDQSVDLFRWDESTNELTRLSSGVGGTGNTDDCSGGWTTRCGVEAVPFSHECIQPAVMERRYCGDDPVALESGEIYFYSPEQLDEGARGRAGDRNLYVWRNGHPRFVTRIDGGRPIQRMDVSFDGKWMAFLTKSHVTPYDNAEHSEMYRYNAETRTLVCVSCRPDGKPATSDVRASVNGYFMSNNGQTFFSTVEPLVNRDADGVTDTYEYVGGRPQLISNGAESGNGNNFQPIGLIGVTADGSDAFFSTYQTLVGQDENGAFYKIYDARINGGFPFEKPSAPCAAADECHGAGNPTPENVRIGSGAELGEGGNYPSGTHRRHHKKKHHRHRRHKQRHGARHRGETTKGAAR